ncbi:hypothetical protein M011DRAFT_460900 [Sporormia fimetaria CBS 119925]|uniref:Uncharacterized protein n=1 Tax=Sporormia fimetaria CBS 119925 TaxID=1340428 RepID=A0A6A6V2T1_9PLEO|nr:hypothetical protein M011DRAFT_460900 [Sporormia fimetaria CBS 119925]
MAASIPPFPCDTALAENLGFLYLAVGGSRVYQQRDQKSLHKTPAKVQDWDLVGLVESKGDILCLVLRKEIQLRSLLGIVDAEYLTWEVLREDKNQENWEVLRFAGTAKDGSKRSLKICSRDHLLHVGSEPAIRRFGVLSSRKVRYTRRYHPRDGHRIFIYQPLKLKEDLFVLDDADFLHPKDDLIAVNPGVTCDLFLTSVPVYEVAPNTASGLKATLLNKWRAISKEPCVEDVIPLLYRFRDFDAQFAQRLRIEFTRVASASPRPLLNLSSPSEMKQSEIRRRQRLQNQYHIVCILDIAWDFWSPRYILSSPTPAALGNHEETFEFRAAAERYCPSPFTSNSEGLFGEICFRTDAEWRRVYAKKAPHVIDELRALPDVLRYFPPSCVQQLLAASAGQLFFRRFEGKMLSKVRLEYYDNKSFLNHIGPMDAVDWFVKIEMQRTEHVGDAYRSTMNMDPILARCAEQHIHRFYYARLESDSRFLEFYSEHCLDILGIYDLKEVRTSDFLNMPLTINGTKYHPLRYYLDRAKDVLDPSAPGGLSSLPEAFGLGDGHGGNVMVTEDHASPKMIYLDYEVSGFHCPFLDIAKSIYNDGFFNVLYADLLCDDATDRQNKSGAVVSWVINSEALCINYSVRVDAIGKTTAITKLEYLLRPIFNLVRRQSLRKAKVAEDVLGNSLLACALLSRNFAKRADIFFLNLALGVRLVDDLRKVLSEVFGWRGLPVVELSIQDMKIEEPPVRELSVALCESRGHACSNVLLLYNLKPEEIFLKRASETFQLQHRFSRKPDESHGTVLHRISDARHTGMKVRPVTL